METVTRTLKKGGDTGKLDRAEVRAVTAAISAGRTEEVLSGAVLQQFRAARRHKPVHHTLKDFGIESAPHTVTLERSAGTSLGGGKASTRSGAVARTREDGIVSLHPHGATREKGKASPRGKKK